MKNEKLVLELLDIKNNLIKKSESIAQLFNSDYIDFLNLEIEKISDICYELLKKEINSLPDEMPDRIAEIIFDDFDSKKTLYKINVLYPNKKMPE